MKKLFSISIYLFVQTVAATEFQPIPYGKFIIEAAWSSLDNVLPSSPLPESPKSYYYYKFLNQMLTLKKSIHPKTHFEYRDGNDPIFALKTTEPYRTAVTSTKIDAKIVFNLSKISNPEKFGYSDAVALLIHELGHKVDRQYIDRNNFIDSLTEIYRYPPRKLPPPKTVEITQYEVDQLATSIAQSAAANILVSTLAKNDNLDTSVIAINNIQNMRTTAGVRLEQQVLQPQVGILIKDTIYPVTNMIFSKYSSEQEIFFIEELQFSKDTAYKMRLIAHSTKTYTPIEIVYEFNISDNVGLTNIKSDKPTHTEPNYEYITLEKFVISATKKSPNNFNAVELTGYANLLGLPQSYWIYPNKKYKLVLRIDGKLVENSIEILSGITDWKSNRYLSITFKSTLSTSFSNLEIIGIPIYTENSKKINMLTSISKNIIRAQEIK